MKKSKIIFSVVGVAVMFILAFCWYIGLFNNIKIEEKEAGGYIVAGMEYTGPYSDAGKFMSDVEEKIKNKGLTSTKGFGIYYDDPKVTPAKECRSFVGDILEEKDYPKIPELQSEGFRVDTIAKASAVVGVFPIRNSLSYMIGPMKVYPAISKYMKEKNYTSSLSLEVYDIPDKNITYIMQH